MEEPEISLHPYLQQQLTRAFIKLVNSGKNVLITTHSDTIVQHINNMIKLNANEKEKREIYIRENVCDIFEMHYSKENAEKYKHIIENVKKYVEKMMED